MDIFRGFIVLLFLTNSIQAGGTISRVMELLDDQESYVEQAQADESLRNIPLLPSLWDIVEQYADNKLRKNIRAILAEPSYIDLEKRPEDLHGQDQKESKEQDELDSFAQLWEQ